MNKMSITPDQLKDSPTKIGSLKGQPVYRLLSKGGLNMIVTKTVLGTRILGLGNHIAIAKSNAKEENPELVIDELSKSEDLPYESFKHLVPFYKDYAQRVELKLNE
jgi:hypothetical protein